MLMPFVDADALAQAGNWGAAGGAEQRVGLFRRVALCRVGFVCWPKQCGIFCRNEEGEHEKKGVRHVKRV